MPRTHSTGKKDANETELIRFYNSIPGVIVGPGMHETAGFDRWVIFRNKIKFIEFKDPAKFQQSRIINRKRVPFQSDLEKAEYKLTDNEKKVRELVGDDYHIVWNRETAKESLGL